jgi:protein-S-isoprenylcysteine O-methyltransferase Ste14
MSASRSTPRIRITQTWSVIVLLAVALSERPGTGTTAGELLSLLGLALMMAAALGRLWTSAHIAGHKDARLITFGPYSLCRHPLYALSLLGGAGVGLAARSFTLTAATLAVLTVLHLRAMRAEDRGLLARHGQTFEAYARRVPALLPSWRHHEVGEETVLNLRVYRKAFLDAGTFVLYYLLIQLLETGRAAGLWPTLMRLW